MGPEDDYVTTNPPVTKSQSGTGGWARVWCASPDVSPGRGHRLQGYPLECSVRVDELPVCVRVRMRVGVCGYAGMCARV